jgi:hypothetical protein
LSSSFLQADIDTTPTNIKIDKNFVFVFILLLFLIN